MSTSAKNGNNASKSEVTSVTNQSLVLSETDRLKLHNVVLQQQLYREQLNGLILQFLQNPQARTLQEKIDEFTKQVNGTVDQMYSQYGMDAATHQLNVETGSFVPKQS